MLLRRSGLLALALAAAAAACAPSVPKENGPSEVDYALFDPTIAELPQPNDLVLAQDPNGLPLPAASRDLIGSFQAAGGFPNDQEVAITIDFGSTTVNASGAQLNSAPDLDLTSFNASTLVVLGINSVGGAAPATLDPIADADYVKGTDHGTLTLHNKGRQRWTAGTHYVVGVRGGANGVKLKNGNPIYPSRTTFLLIQDRDLSLPENQALLITQFGSRQIAAANGALLEQIRKGYLLPFGAIDNLAFSHHELALIQTFQIAPLNSAHVETDPGAGLIPLPSNFLLDPATGGKTVVNNPAFGPAAAGLATLDGFSTTAMIIAQTSDSIPIDASTVTNAGATASVALYDLTNPAAPVRVDPSTYEAEPSAIAQTPTGGKCVPAAAAPGTCFAKLVGLQPAAPAVSFGAAAFTTRPLKEATTYAVVITDRVKDANTNPLSRSTLGKVLLFADPLANLGTTPPTSNLTGIDAGTAAGLEVMRLQLQPVIGKVQTDLGLSKDHIAMAYTFRTQSITGTALTLGALPYKGEPSAPVFPTGPIGPSGTNCVNCIVTLTPPQAFGHYGLDLTLVPSGNILEVIEGKIITLNLLDPATGAFRPDPTVCLTGTACIEPIGFTMSVPLAANVPACPAGFPAPPGARCAPLVIFRHGINGGRGDMLQLADAFAAQGMVVAAIDAPKHGDRAYCQADSECVSPATCVHDPAMTKQGDAAGATPGKCSSATATSTGFVSHPVRCPTGSVSPTCTGFNPAAGGGVSTASGNFVISANFFRARDTFRQDILDESMLVRTMAPASAISTHAIQAELGSKGIVIRPDLVYFIGQSLGTMNGVVDVAVNPRISKAVLNVGGATITDTFVNSPSYAATLNALFTSLGAAPGTAKFLQLLSVAKWILDPADPINFANHLIAAPLPNLITGAATPPAQAAKKVLGQRAECDQTVPDAFEILLDYNVGLATTLAPTPTEQIFTTDANFVTPFTCTAGASSPGAVSHSFLLNYAIPTLTAKAQADAAAFLANDTQPPAIETP